MALSPKFEVFTGNVDSDRSTVGSHHVTIFTGNVDSGMSNASLYISPAVAKQIAAKYSR